MDAADPAYLERLFRAKAAAEREQADALDPPSAGLGSDGPPTAAVLLLKGEYGPATASAAGPMPGPLSPAEVEAASKALAALGLPAGDLAALATRGVASPPSEAADRRLSLAVEACDPAWVVALDGVAAEDAARALGIEALGFGKPLVVAGRVWLAVDGLEASRADPARKRRVWVQLKALAEARPPGEPAPVAPTAPSGSGAARRASRLGERPAG